MDFSLPILCDASARWDVNLAFVEIDIWPAQSAKFARAQPAKGRDKDEGPPSAGGAGYDGLQLCLGWYDRARIVTFWEV